MSTVGLPNDPARTKALHDSLREAVAVSACLVIVESLHLEFGYLGVMTTHMVMNQFTFSSFQKGIERVLGRAIGIFYGIVLVGLFYGAPVVGALFELLGLLVFFYIYFSGRLAYTFLNCGLYLAAIVEIGRHQPDRVVSAGLDMIVAIALGVIIADLANWVTRAEESLTIHTEGNPLFPLRGAWISHSFMLVVTVVLTLIWTRSRDLPVSQSVISVMMISVTTDQQSLVRKGGQRLVGAALAGAWGFFSFMMLARIPRFPLLVALLFLGMYVAGYWTRTSKTMSYGGLQMGLVLPMVMVVPPAEFGSLSVVLQRIEGVAIGLIASIIVSSLWPDFRKQNPEARGQRSEVGSQRSDQRDL